MRNRNFSSLLILVAALSVVACNRLPTGPSDITDPVLNRKPIDAPDNWHRLVDPNGNPVATKVRLNWVNRVKGGNCGTAGCFQMNATACRDESTSNPMVVGFYFSEDGKVPSSGGAGFREVANGSCLEIEEGTVGTIMSSGTRHLIGWYGPLVRDFGEPGLTSRLGGTYVWDLGDY